MNSIPSSFIVYAAALMLACVVVATPLLGPLAQPPPGDQFTQLLRQGPGELLPPLPLLPSVSSIPNIDAFPPDQTFGPLEPSQPIFEPEVSASTTASAFIPPLLSFAPVPESTNIPSDPEPSPDSTIFVPRRPRSSSSTPASPPPQKKQPPFTTDSPDAVDDDDDNNNNENNFGESLAPDDQIIVTVTSQPRQPRRSRRPIQLRPSASPMAQMSQRPNRSQAPTPIVTLGNGPNGVFGSGTNEPEDVDEDPTTATATDDEGEGGNLLVQPRRPRPMRSLEALSSMDALAEPSEDAMIVSTMNPAPFVPTRRPNPSSLPSSTTPEPEANQEESETITFEPLASDAEQGVEVEQETASSSEEATEPSESPEETPLSPTMDATTTTTTTEEVNTEEASSSPEEASEVCVDASYLHKGGYSGNWLVHSESVQQAEVYCPLGEHGNLPCATADHMVRFKGEGMSYRQLCGTEEVSCNRRRMSVNSVLSHLWTEVRVHDDVVLTMLDARHPEFVQKSLHRLVSVKRSIAKALTKA